MHPCRPRVVLVLGAGGLVGHAYHVGVLNALVDELGWDARRAELIVGTSAGAAVGATLRAGLAPDDMRRRLSGEPLSPQGADLVRRAERAIVPEADDAGPTSGRRLRIASPQRVRRALREPWKVTPGSLLSALIPPGSRTTDHLRVPYEALHGEAWPDRPLWIVAVDLDVGSRVVFGRDGSPATSVGRAVGASCAIPGYFAPVAIDGARYVDGAVHSTTNADLAGALGPGPGLVLVSAPMSAVSAAVPRGPRLSMRQLASRQVAGEVAALRAAGATVVTLQPTADDLALMAGDSMDPAKTADVGAQARASARAHLHEPGIAERLGQLSGK